MRRTTSTANPLAFALLALLLTACSQAKLEANFVPASDAWTRWEAHQGDAAQVVDHEPWDAFLVRYLRSGENGLNRVAYKEVTPADRQNLEAYIESLQDTRISTFNQREQFAFWVNLYNAVTVRTVLDHYPVASIRDINDGFLSQGPWDRPLVTVEGESVTLNDIENRILRPLWNDPRTHYVLNCASVGCPNLEAMAYRGKDLETRLDAAARSYINNSRGVRVHGGRLVVSSIYAWFEEDFGGSEQAVLAHLKRYANPDLSRDLARHGKIGGYDYDWALNDAP